MRRAAVGAGADGADGADAGDADEGAEGAGTAGTAGTVDAAAFRSCKAGPMGCENECSLISFWFGES